MMASALAVMGVTALAIYGGPIPALLFIIIVQLQALLNRSR